MKIIFFSDIHGNGYAYDAFLKDIFQIEYDRIIFCGDIFGYYYQPLEILKSIRENNISAIKGNHEQLFLDMYRERKERQPVIERYGSSYKYALEHIDMEDVEYLESLDDHLILDIDGKMIGVYHGTPGNPLNGRLYPDTKVEPDDLYQRFDCVIIGHTHHKMVKKCGTTLILNPGSLGQQRDGKGCSYMILDTETLQYEFKIVSYPQELVGYEVDQYDGGRPDFKEVLFRKR